VRRYVARNSSGGIFQIMSTVESRKHFEDIKNTIGLFILALPFVFLVSPLFFIATIVFMALFYHRNIYAIFFNHKEVTAKYKMLLEPLVTKTLFSVVGYRVYPEELETHLQLINSDEDEDKKKLAKKGTLMRKNLYRQFGFNIDNLCRHAIFLGTTGSGKTETIMSFFTDVIKASAGIGLVDGKSDQPMEFKIYNLCKEYYYETQFYAIILNKPEEGSDSNTYSAVLSYNSSLKASEFLGEFIGSGGGGGNQDYFANRGKVMLGNIVMHFKNRQRYYNENFTLADLSAGYTPVEMNNIYFMSYCIAKNIDSLLRKIADEDIGFAKIIQRARGIKTPIWEDLEYIDFIYEYLNQNVHLIRSAEQKIGIDFSFLSDYYTLFSLVNDYMSGISPTWGKYAKVIAEATYAHYIQEEREFLYTNAAPVSMREIRGFYRLLKNDTNPEHKRAKTHFVNSPDDMKTLIEALGLADSKENIEKISNDAMQQHQYAMQQWTRLFALFREYSRVMGVPYPDVDGEDIIRNNKVLYVMLPVMELSSDQINMLGKMFILMFKNIASLALGGDRQSATPIQFKIYQNKMKPNPVFLMVLDEIGSYIINGLSIIASQVRSLSIALLISGQDSVSVEPSEEGQREKARLLANLAKLVLRNRDADTHEFEKMIPETEVIESDNFVHSAVSKNVIGSRTLKVSKIRNFEIAQSSRFNKGFGVYIDGARDEPTYFQSYYLGDNSIYPSQIRKYEAFTNLYQDY